MLKRTLCAALALVMLVCAFPLAALAEETKAPYTLQEQGIPAAMTVIGSSAKKYYEDETVRNNNSRDRANYLSQDNTVVIGDVGYTGDKYDFYKITLSRSYYLEFVGVSGAGGENSTRFRLTNSSGKVLKTASYAGEENTDDYFTFSTTLSAGTYYIRVTDSENWVSYNFAFAMAPAADAPKVTTSNKASSGKPVLKWSAVDNAKNYRIYRSTSKDGTFKYLDSATKTTFTDTTAKAGRKYYYKVKTMGDDTVMDSKYSSIVSVTCDCARPDVWLTHRSTTGKNIVKWEEVYGAEKYRVYVATSKDGNYKLLGTTSKLYLVHSSGASNKMYYYKVKAINEKTSAADSAYSVVVGQRTK